jgi:uncharacterized protein YuzE
MTKPYLEITYRKGRPFAAYLYLPRQPADRSARTEQYEGGVVIDFTEDGRPIGVEITSLKKESKDALSRGLAEARGRLSDADQSEFDSNLATLQTV